MNYQASTIKKPTTKKRTRRTKKQMEALRGAIHDLARDHRVCTVRHIYYLGIGLYWDKDTGGKRNNYSNVVRLAGQMREDNLLPWDWISDNTRWVRRPSMYLSAEDALDSWVKNYRRDLMAYQPLNVEVWCESDSIAGVIEPITSRYGIELFVCRGQASKAYVREAVMYYRQDRRPVHILFVGDWDPSGIAIGAAVNERIQRYGNERVNLHFERIGVTADDVRSGRYTSHASNRRDSNFKRFKAICADERLDPGLAVEVEAIPPGELRTRLESAIEDRLDRDQWHASAVAEQSEREHLATMRTLMGDMRP